MRRAGRPPLGERARQLIAIRLDPYVLADAMRSFFLRFRSLAGWSSPPLADEDTSASGPDRQRAERVLAAARVFFAAAACAAVWLNPTQPARYASTVYTLPATYLIMALALWLPLGRTAAPSPWLQRWTHASDLLWAALLTAITEGPHSLFFLLFMFVLLAAASRWGFEETIKTAFVAVGLLFVEAVLMNTGEDTTAPLGLGGFDMHQLIIRSTYLIVGGGLLGYLAEEEKQRRGEAATITRIVSTVRAEASLWATFEAIAAEVVGLVGAGRLLLLFDEVQSGRAFLWTADRTADGALRISESEVAPADADRYRFEAPGDAWRATPRSGLASREGWDILAIDADGRRVAPRPLEVPDAWTGARPSSSIVGVTIRFADIGSGLVMLFNAQAAALPQLRFLQRLATHLAPALYSVYLLRRVRSRIGTLERARLARELHDGIIQSLIGLEMQVEALRRSPRDVAQVIEGLAKIQQHLASEIRDVRDVMHELEPTDFAPRRLLEQLQELVDRFQRETGIAAQFVSDVDEVTLAPPVCHELARITQEALVNVRKHSGAHNVVVRFTSEAGCPKLIIDNDGRGLGFTGRLSQAELDRRRTGPVVIKERVRAMGADLAVESSERGVRLEITLPPRTIVRHKTA